MATQLPFSVVSFNMHGMNQGLNVLSSLCNSSTFDISAIFVQEHWLTPSNMSTLKMFSSNYIGYGISAMEHIVGLNVLKGRPFGGVCILLKSNLANNVKFKYCSERYVIIAFNNTLLINVYFPKIVNDDVLCTVQSTLVEIQDIIDQFPNHNIVCGGDFNENFDFLSNRSQVLACFINNNDLV